MNQDHYIAWDLETSGLSAERDYILEIGAIEYRAGEKVREKSWLLNHGIEIKPEVSAIHGITKDLIDAEGTDPKAAIDEFLEWFEEPKWANLTHNGFRFDIPFLLEALTKHNTFNHVEREVIKKELYGNGMDSAVLYKARELGLRPTVDETFPWFAKRVLDIRAYGVKYNVGHCCETLGIDRTGIAQHRALADIHLTNEIYRKLV